MYWHTNELNNIASVEHSKHSSFDNFIVNLLGALVHIVSFLRNQQLLFKGQ